MTDFATDPGAQVTPMTPAELATGLTCGTLSIGQLNWIFQQLFAGTVNLVDCNGDPLPAAAAVATCADLAAAIAAIPADKFVQGLQSYNPTTNIMTMLMSDGSTVDIDMTTLLADAINVTDNGDGTTTILVGSTPHCVASCGANDWIAPEMLVVGEPTRLSPTVNDVGCDPLSAVISNAVNCAVTVGADGVHTVTASNAACGAGMWSYDYTVDCGGSPSTAHVSGIVDNVLEPFPFSINATSGSGHNLTITLVLGGTYDVDWGDGTVSTGIASGTQASHSYAAAYAGPVHVLHNACNAITRFVSTLGQWNFDIANLPSGLTYYDNAGSNTTTGNIANLPSGLTHYYNAGSNTTTGNIANLPSGLAVYLNTGSNTTTGNIANLPSGLTYYLNTGSNTTTGNIASLPSGLTYYRNEGSNTTYGNIASLPSGLTYYLNYGSNTTTGNIANLPSGLAVYLNTGSNTTYGDIASLPSGLTVYSNEGVNTTTGDIANLQFALTYYANYGSNTTYGNIANLPSGLTIYINAGFNTTTGDIASLPSGLTYYYNAGSNTTTALTTTWGAATTGFRYFLNHGATGTRNSTQVDNMLVALTNVTSWAVEKSVYVEGAANAAPTATGLAAKATILGNGALIVVHN